MLLREHHSFPLSRSGRRVSWTLRLGRLIIIILVLTVLGGGIWVERKVLLLTAAELWIVSDPVSHADAAVVLGGGLDGRPFVAAKLYEQGLVKTILVSQVDDNSPAVAIGVGAGHTEANRQVLLKLGVPATAIDTFGMANKNTKDEAVALHAWAERHHASAIIIPVEIFAARRVRWMFDREFSGQLVQIAVQSFDPPNYARTSWWQNEYGLIAFQNEILKYIYYRLKY
jgi:vancomycin permeability regulator SanA